jgi:hypothetical protein
MQAACSSIAAKLLPYSLRNQALRLQRVHALTKTIMILPFVCGAMLAALLMVATVMRPI